MATLTTTISETKTKNDKDKDNDNDSDSDNKNVELMNEAKKLKLITAIDEWKYLTSDYDINHNKNEDVDIVICAVCDQEMKSEKVMWNDPEASKRIVYQYRHQVTSRYNCVFFKCSDAQTPWHKQAKRLREEIRFTGSPSLEKTLKSEYDFVLTNKCCKKQVEPNSKII